MNTVGIRELKTHLSRHLKRVRSGARLLVTERGRVIASIDPVEAPDHVEWAHALVAAGHAHWGGGKPEGCRHPVATTTGRTVSAVVLEDRR
jgi:prevent-host-death family protein